MTQVYIALLRSEAIIHLLYRVHLDFIVHINKNHNSAQLERILTLVLHKWFQQSLQEELFIQQMISIMLMGALLVQKDITATVEMQTETVDVEIQHDLLLMTKTG